MRYLIRGYKSPIRSTPPYILAFKPKVKAGDFVTVKFDNGDVYDMVVVPHEGYPCINCDCGSIGFMCPASKHHSCLVSGLRLTLKFINNIMEEI